MRRFWVIACGILLCLVAGEAAYWWIASERLRAGYQDWVASQTAQGWSIGSGSVSIGGWPRSATIAVPNLTLAHAGPTIPGDVNVASGGVTMSVSLINPTRLALSLTGPMTVRVGDLPDIVLTGDETSVSVPLRQTGPVSIALYGRGLQLDAAARRWRVTIGRLDAQAQIAEVSPADQSQPAATFALTSEAIVLPAGVKWPLGPNVSSLSLDGRVNGPLPPTRHVTHWAEAWRDGGGSLEVTHLAVNWGPLTLTSAATLALDEQLQPMGSGNGRIVGYVETLDRLAAGGMLTKSAATAAKAVLSLMAETGDPNEPPSVDVPLTLQYRTLSMRQVPLLRLPEVDWPAN